MSKETIMPNSLFATPRFVSFRHVVNRINELRVVHTARGEQTQLAKSDPNLSVGIGYIDHVGDISGIETFQFGHEDGSFISLPKLLQNAGVDMSEAWELAFDATKELFEKTRDQPETMGEIGVRWAMRVDVVEANLNPRNEMGIVFIIGCYSDDTFSKLRASFTLSFADKKSLSQFENVKKQLSDRIADLKQMIAGTHVAQVGLSPDDLRKSKESAAADIVVVQGQLDERGKLLVGPMSSVLSLPTVQQAFGKVAQVVFIELQKTLPEWSAIEVPKLMAHFAAAFANTIQS